MLLGEMEKQDWAPWLKRLDDDPKTYLPNAYAVEFLRHNLTRERLSGSTTNCTGKESATESTPERAQQRTQNPSASQHTKRKFLWGDLADLFHLVYLFSPDDEPVRKHFDRNIILMAFIWETARWVSSVKSFVR